MSIYKPTKEIVSRDPPLEIQGITGVENQWLKIFYECQQLSSLLIVTESRRHIQTSN